MDQRIFEFDTRNEDTCMQNWTFKLNDWDGSPVIEQLEIERASQGCPGHPKTISALVKNRTLESIDLDGLAETDCPRSISCGQMLGKCLANIKKTN